MIFQKPFLINFGTTLEHPHLYGTLLYEISIVRSLIPLLLKEKGTSHAWRKMAEVREEVKHDIWWQIKSGELSFWFDNWTNQGALYYIEEQGE